MEFADLRGRVQNLRARASHGEQSRHRAEQAANQAQIALAEADAENKQLKGSVPWLEARLVRGMVVNMCWKNVVVVVVVYLCVDAVVAVRIFASI